MRLRKLIVGVAAIGMPLTVLTTVGGAGTAWATTGTGFVSCSKIVGTITFKPPLKNGGVTAETTTTKSTSTGCTGGTPNPTKTIGVSVHHSSNNNCTGLTMPTAVTIHLTYTPVVTASTFTGTATPTSSPPGFTLQGTVTGSYPSSPGGAKATVVIKQTTTQILAACKSSTGLKSLTIIRGTSTES